LVQIHDFTVLLRFQISRNRRI